MVGGGPPPGLAARRRWPRLSARLDAALHTTTQLTVVGALPGYGMCPAMPLTLAFGGYLMAAGDDQIG